MSLKIMNRSDLPSGDILNAPEQTVIVTTNCEGAMGRGIALACRERYPEIYRKYKILCKSGIYTPNSLLYSQVSPDQQILLFPTKIKWRDPSPIELIEDNLIKLSQIYDQLNITSLAVPPLGQANGWITGKAKENLRNFIFDTLERMSIPCTYYDDE